MPTLPVAGGKMELNHHTATGLASSVAGLFSWGQTLLWLPSPCRLIKCIVFPLEMLKTSPWKVWALRTGLQLDLIPPPSSETIPSSFAPRACRGTIHIDRCPICILADTPYRMNLRLAVSIVFIGHRRQHPRHRKFWTVNARAAIETFNDINGWGTTYQIECSSCQSIPKLRLLVNKILLLRRMLLLSLLLRMTNFFGYRVGTGRRASAAACGNYRIVDTTFLCRRCWVVFFRHGVAKTRKFQLRNECTRIRVRVVVYVRESPAFELLSSNFNCVSFWIPAATNHPQSCQRSFRLCIAVAVVASRHTSWWSLILIRVRFFAWLKIFFEKQKIEY